MGRVRPEHAVRSTRRRGWASDAAPALVRVPPLPARAEIEASWQRSALCGLEREQQIELPWEPLGDAPVRLEQIAKPTVVELASLVLPSAFAVILAEPRGRLVQVRCEDPELAAALEAMQAVPGRVWQEQYAGTNAIGMVLEQLEPCAVIGREHYLDALGSLSCVATPIVNPLTHRHHGVLAMATRSGTTVALMPATVRLAGHAIQQRIGEDASAVERTLLTRFLTESRRSTVPILARSPRVELASPAATGMLTAPDHALLWERAHEAVSSFPSARLDLSLADGGELAVEVERVGSQVGDGVVVRLAPPEGRRSAPASPKAADLVATNLIAGRTDAARHLRREAERLARHVLPICIDGERGSGKLTVALSIAGQAKFPRPTIIDAARSSIDGAAAILRHAAAAVRQADATVIVEHVECLDARVSHALAMLIAEADGAGARVIMTHTTRAGTPAESDAVPVAALRLHVPPLREHIDDVLDLVPILLQRHGSTAEAPLPVLRALIRYDWPGNVAELDVVIRGLVEHAGGGTVRLDDLPTSCHGSWRCMGRMEHVERAAIVRALHETNGSKARAAQILGIGRATLYRKIRAFGLDLDTGAP